MRFQFQSPALLLAAFIVVALAATAATIGIAAMQPALSDPVTTRADALPLIHDEGADRLIVGLMLQHPGDATPVGDRASLAAWVDANPSQGILFEPMDFVEDPDMLPSYEASDRFYARQGVISAILSAGGGQVIARSADSGFSGGIELRPVTVEAMRGVASLPGPFWIQVASGLAVIVVAAVFLALRPKSFAVISFAFAGLGITGAAYMAAIYSSRQFGMEPGLMLVLSELNHVFTVSFGVGMIALFSVYPVRIASPVASSSSDASAAAVTAAGCWSA